MQIHLANARGDGRVVVFKPVERRGQHDKESKFRQAIASTRCRVARCIIGSLSDCLSSHRILNRVRCNFLLLSHKTAFGNMVAETWLGRFRAFLASAVRDCGPLRLAPENGEPFRLTGQKENVSRLSGGALLDVSCGDSQRSLGCNDESGNATARLRDKPSDSDDYGFLSLASLKQCYGTERVLPYGSTFFVGALLFLFLLFLLLLSF